jgi:hypothetical protein
LVGKAANTFSAVSGKSITHTPTALAMAAAMVVNMHHTVVRFNVALVHQLRVEGMLKDVVRRAKTFGNVALRPASAKGRKVPCLPQLREAGAGLTVKLDAHGRHIRRYLQGRKRQNASQLL